MALAYAYFVLFKYTEKNDCCPTFVLQLLLETRRGDVPDGGCADQRHHVVRDVSRCGGLLLFPAKIPHTQRRVQQRQTSNVGSHGSVRNQMPKKHPKAVRLFFHSSIIFIHKGPQVKILPASDAIFWRGVSWPFSWCDSFFLILSTGKYFLNGQNSIATETSKWLHSLLVIVYPLRLEFSIPLRVDGCIGFFYNLGFGLAQCYKNDLCTYSCDFRCRLFEGSWPPIWGWCRDPT